MPGNLAQLTQRRVGHEDEAAAIDEILRASRPATLGDLSRVSGRKVRNPNPAKPVPPMGGVRG